MFLKKFPDMLADGNIAMAQADTAEQRIEFQQVAAIPNDGDIKTGMIDVQGMRDTNDKIQGRLGNVLIIDLGSLRDIITKITFAPLAPICIYDLLTHIDDAQIASDRQIFLDIENDVVTAISIEIGARLN